MRTLLFICCSFFTIQLQAQENNNSMKNIYDFSAKTIDGEDFNFSDLKGKKIMIVNTASECGNTPQYAVLQEMHEMYSDNNFVIIGFPCNQFGVQEPGTNEEITAFCKKNYGVEFQMMEKIEVKGDAQHPLYKWLTEKEGNGKADAPVRWNFQKFLINEDGTWHAVIEAGESPANAEIINWIKGN